VQGRPKGADKKTSLEPVAKRLSGGWGVEHVGQGGRLALMTGLLPAVRSVGSKEAVSKHVAVVFRGNRAWGEQLHFRPQPLRAAACNPRPHRAELLGQEVALAPDCIGAEVQQMKTELKDGQVLLLENVR
jgi:hypothetical protein